MDLDEIRIAYLHVVMCLHYDIRHFFFFLLILK